METNDFLGQDSTRFLFVRSVSLKCSLFQDSTSSKTGQSLSVILQYRKLLHRRPTTSGYVSRNIRLYSLNLKADSRVLSIPTNVVGEDV